MASFLVTRDHAVQPIQEGERTAASIPRALLLAGKNANQNRTVYTGETGHRLTDRFREHRLDVLQKKSDLAVAQHLRGLDRLKGSKNFV